MVSTLKNFFRHIYEILSNLFTSNTTKKIKPIFDKSTNWYGLTLGINKYDSTVYYGNEQKLEGCINDSNNIISAFKVKEWVQLLDKQATISNFIDNFIKISNKIKEGDIFFIHHSRHGSTLEAGFMDGDEKIDEAAVLYDGMMVDDCILRMFKTLPKCTVIYVNDSCYSESQYKDIKFVGGVTDKLQITTKALSPTYLASKNNILDIKQLEKIIPVINSKLKANIISISGCKDSETSADAFVEGIKQGALTWAFLKVLRTNPKLKIADLQLTIRNLLKKTGFSQNPVVVVEGDKSLYQKSFLDF